MKNKWVDIFFVFGKHWLVLLVYCSEDIQTLPKALLSWVLVEHHNLCKIFEEAIFEKVLYFQHLGSHLFAAFPEKSKIVVEECKEEFVGIVDDLAIEDIEYFIEYVMCIGILSRLDGIYAENIQVIDLWDDYSVLFVILELVEEPLSEVQKLEDWVRPLLFIEVGNWGHNFRNDLDDFYLFVDVYIIFYIILVLFFN